jgi:dGTP triphosphohydrolase
MQDAHENEYLAAAAAIHEQTPRPCQLPAVGDFVSGMTDGKRWSCYVQSIEPRRLVVEADGAWLAVDPSDITH